MSRSFPARSNRFSAALLAAFLLLFSSCGGGGGGENSAYTNPEWRASVGDPVIFPLEVRIVLRVGISGAAPDPASESMRWLTEATNIEVRFESIPSSPGDVELGMLMRRGELYDIIVEGRLPIGDDLNRQILVDFREFADHVPNAKRLAETNGSYRSGLAAKMTLDDELYSLGSFDPDRLPYSGSLAYRRDLFEKHRLPFDTWEELVASLRKLKELYPSSVPLGALPDNIYTVYPALFGSGMVKNQVVYFDPERGSWEFGPYQPVFERFVTTLHELYAEGVLMPELFMLKSNDTIRYFSTDTIFVAPWAGRTGPYFPFQADGYGKLTASGDWDGTGKWIESMPIPATADGSRGTITSKLFSSVGTGWNVYNQSEHVAAAIALVDFFFDPTNALAARLGPPGEIWSESDGVVGLVDGFTDAYSGGGLAGVLQQSAGSAGTIPLAGLSFSTASSLFGDPDNPELAYFRKYDASRYLPGIAIPLDPGIRYSVAEDFDYDRASTVVGLESFVESEVAKFIVGQRPISEYREFVDECAKRGADKLLELYRSNTDLFAGPIF